MRILLVVHGYPPDAAGGTEIYAHDLAQAHRRAGEEVVVLTREAAPSRPEHGVRREERDGIVVYRLNQTFRHARSYEDLYRPAAVRRRLAAVLAEIRPDVAHLHHLTCLTTELVDELAERRIPTLFTLHDYWMICQRGQLLDLDGRRCDGPHRGCRRCADAVSGLGTGVGEAAPWLRRLASILPIRLRERLTRLAGRSRPAAAAAARDARVAHTRAVLARADLLLAPSRTLEARFLEYGIARRRLVHRPAGIDLRRFDGAAAQVTERAPGAPLRLGYLGSLMLSKAPHLLLEAFAGLPAGAATLDVYGAVAAYHGDDSYRLRLAPLLARPRVRHHGPVAHAAVPAALAGLDALVVPSIWLENAPFVILEAFAAGVPVVASDLGGMAEAVEDGVNGLLFRAGDVADLTRVLRRLVDEEGLVARLRGGIRPVLSIDEDAVDLRELYRRLADEGAARAPARRRLAAVVLCHRTPDDAVLAVRSLRSSRRPVDRLVVVDNGSGAEGVAALRRRLPGVEVLDTGANLGFSAGIDLGIQAVLAAGNKGPADAVFLLNADAMVAPDTLERLEAAVEGGVGLAAPIVLTATDPTRQETAGIAWAPAWGRMRHQGCGDVYDPALPPATRRVDGASGCALWVERAVFDAVGSFDPEYFFSFEDLDLCLRASAAGFATVVVGDAVAYHQGSRSIGATSPRRLYFAARNHLRLAALRAPLPAPLGLPRAAVIVALNLAFALRPRPSRLAAVRAVTLGVVDHCRGRYGCYPSPSR